MEIITAIFGVVILIISVVIHEVSHGFMAEKLGDPTARLAGRLTLNPIKHIDPIGSVVVPLALFILGSSFLVGWAKPVPYNPSNLKSGRWSESLVAFAGPLSNIIIALVFGLIIRFFPFLPNAESLSSVLPIFTTIVIVNLVLAIFNLIPIPPLDGSKIAISLFPAKIGEFMRGVERSGFILVFLFLVLAWRFVEIIVLFVFKLLTGFGF